MWFLIALCLGAADAFSPTQRPVASFVAKRHVVLRSSPMPNAPALAPTQKKETDKQAKNSKGDHELLLFDDPVNTREFVSRILCTKVALTEDQAFDVMMLAHTTGVGVVGTYNFEVAENYCTIMTTAGLTSEVRPVKDEE
ncbi:hypothetical protein M885DRAFT_518532 [Pelagophyceae sp. CCMP2097]|nr:hypothetical protein M885DRAFT_518532 [Pelagophyceae sp. CCMP2097]